MKQGIQIIASEETYMNLSTFKEVNELNEVIRTYKERFKSDLTKSAIKVLEFIQRYSTKYLGVSFLSKNNIADKLEISRRTVIRVCQLLESLGIIKQYEMKRSKDMMQTSNAIVIQPIEKEFVTQEVVELSHQENNTFLKQNLNNHLNVKRSAYIKFVPRSLQQFQAYLGSLVKDLYGRVWLAAKKLNVISNQETMQNIGFIALDQIKQYIKSGKQLTNEQQLKLAYKIAFNQLQQVEDDIKPVVPVDYSYMLTITKKTKPSPITFMREELNELGIY